MPSIAFKPFSFTSSSPSASRKVKGSSGRTDQPVGELAFGIRKHAHHKHNHPNVQMVFASSRDMIVNADAEQKFKTPPRKKSGRELKDLPTEIWARIVSYIPNLAPFSAACRATHGLLSDRHVRCACLYGKYGVPLALYQAYTHHHRLLRQDPQLVKLMIRGGARVPRFFAQQLVRHHKNHPRLPYLESFILEEAYMTYGWSTDFQSTDDIMAFESLTNDLEQNLDQVRELISSFYFVPLETVTPTATIRLYQLLQADISILDVLIHQNGMDPRAINDTFMRQLLSSSKNRDKAPELLPEYIKRGFSLSRQVVISQLRDCPTPCILMALKNYVPKPLLLSCAHQVLRDYFGPSSPGFYPETVEHIVSTFDVPDSLVKTILFHPANVYALPYATRCFEQSNPVPVWRWVVGRYGAGHAFSVKCFDDLLVWVSELGQRWKRVFRNASANESHLRWDGWPESDDFRQTDLVERYSNQGPWGVILEFIDRGATLRPRHIPYLTKIHGVSPVVPAVALGRVLTIFRRNALNGHIGITECERREWVDALKNTVTAVLGSDPSGSTSSRKWKSKSWSTVPSPGDERRRSGSSTSALSFMDVVRQMLVVLGEDWSGPGEKTWRAAFKMGLPAGRAKTWDVGGEGRWGWLRKGLGLR
ncbi:hypothetical protein SpCBS45565_g07736 [Spizellomyces sp. 'palustris']|nr:hypothetical protein SpCBS45565_g07736 [Spizellomyces sp. 'palustris']